MVTGFPYLTGSLYLGYKRKDDSAIKTVKQCTMSWENLWTVTEAQHPNVWQ